MSNYSALFEKFGHSMEAGKIIFREGEEGDQMYIIHSGKVKISRNIAGKEHTLAIMGKGDFFGEMAIVNRIRRTATATAIDRVELLAFTREGFQSMIKKNAQIALSVIDKLCRRLQNTNLHIQHLARKNARGMVAMNLRFAFQGAGMGQAVLHYDRTVEEIARNLELSLNTVKSYFEDFRKSGMISLESNTIRLADAKKMNELAENVGG
jgi:CRP-like cAMP-binding protein